MNVNTKEYWDRRFASGDWQVRRGPVQTMQFARAQIPLLGLPGTFDGTFLDFGCGTGDAFPLYKNAFPKATLIGVDHSPRAIDACRARFGSIASFLVGDHTVVPRVSVVLSSNVLEHLSCDVEVAGHLLSCCRQLFIVVPYGEVIAPGGEHVNSYDEHSFAVLRPIRHKVFVTRGWSQFGYALWYRVYLKNLVRLLVRRSVRPRRKQILFHFVNAVGGPVGAG
jgi:SAM-dependent methyltransferase